MKIPKILVFPISMAILIALSFLVGLLAHWFGAFNPNGWGFFTLFTILGALIFYVIGRQIYWVVAGKGFYEGRVGFLKRLWTKIFKNENQDKKG
jgi:hypothetical protein